MQQVLHFSSLQTGLAWMSGSVPSILFAGVSQRLVTRRGPKVALGIGVSLVAAGVIWGTQIPVHGHFLANLAGPFVLAGAGTAFSFIPISIAVLAGVRQHQAGLASGLMNTSIQLGAALGIAIASSVAASHTQALLHTGTADPAALAAGYHHALWLLGVIALLALPAIFALIRRNHTVELAHSDHRRRGPAGARRNQLTHSNAQPTTQSHTRRRNHVHRINRQARQFWSPAPTAVSGKRWSTKPSAGAQPGVRGVAAAVAHPDDRVTPVIMDVTDWAQIQRAVESVESLDILINNAGLSLPDDLNSRAAFEQHFDVNVYGPVMVTQALLPALTQSRGRIVNVVSIGAFAAVPVLPAYSASKAAAFSITQSLRALLAGQGVKVHAVMPGPIDTDMIRDLPIPKTPPESVAKAILDGVENGDEEIFPDPLSQMFAESWRDGRGQGVRAPERRARTRRTDRGLNARHADQLADIPSWPATVPGRGPAPTAVLDACDVAVAAHTPPPSQTRRSPMSETRSEYNAKIVAEFRANEGRVGGTWEEIPLLLLHHTGAKSGVQPSQPDRLPAQRSGLPDLGRERRSAEQPRLVPQPKRTPQHANRGRHRDDRCHSGGTRQARSASASSQELPSATRSSPKPRARPSGSSR